MKIRLPAKDQYTLISNLGTMLSAGIPILDAVSSLEDEFAGDTKKILQQLHKDINEGKKISQSFEKFEESFDKTTINLIKSAEESGNLDTTLKQISEYIKKNMEFTSKICSALIYPTLVVLLFFGIVLVILTYVMPRISEVFSKLNVDIPLPTQILINTSEFFLNYTWQILVVILLFIIGFTLLLIFKKREILNLLFSIPPFSKLANTIDMARFTNNLGTLLKSGVPITKAIEYAGEVVMREKTYEAIDKAGFLVTGGKPLSEGFRKSPDIFPNMLVRITQAGEKSGTLEQSMFEVSEQYEAKVDEALKTITTVLEPLLLIVIGGFVGGIMLSIIAPIYKIIGDISPR